MQKRKKEMKKEKKRNGNRSNDAWKGMLKAESTTAAAALATKERVPEPDYSIR